MKNKHLYTLSFVIFASMLLFCSSSHAQKNEDKELWLSHFGQLYPSASGSDKPLGTFVHGAKVTLMTPSDTIWQQVRMDNGMVGYVKKELLTSSLMGSTETPPEPFVDPKDSQVYGSPHLFIQAAGLKARVAPNDAKVACIKHMGEAVGVDFVPVDPEAWVNIGNCNASDNAYIQRKFLGKRPDIKTLLAQYDALPAADVNARRVAAERLVELAWQHGNLSYAKPALERFLQLAKELNNPTMIENTELALLLADSMTHEIPFEQKEKLWKKNTFQVIVGGFKVNYDGLPKLSQVNTMFGAPRSIKNVTNECGGYGEEDKTYIYPQAEFEVESKTGKTYLTKMWFTNEGNAYIHNNHRFDKNTTEREFLTKTRGWVWSLPLESPNVYRTPDGDAGFHIFTFKNGFLFEYEVVVMC